ncbi:MAG: ribonuclease III [Planctomycetota bacterium]|nr:MAG: ribonuclease III [Planctomycetota bacterium]REJ91306.1 MAG: ribonuclease III [Planctomycetota bacterium]REK20916.1 MAG: ribonuclease III [Planctomycetota bacterium]REK37303.1 MAG: ribonuclease III [Planctomycetota bacterium]
MPTIRHSLPTELTEDLLSACEQALQYEFTNRQLLRRALTHASAARTRLESNERLEFLGDSLLGAIVCNELFEKYPGSPEGELTRVKSVVVSRATCCRLADRLGLQNYLLAGRGITIQNHVPDSVLAAQFEALVAAIFLDGGFSAATEFVLREVQGEIERASESATGVNYKSLLQHFGQRDSGEAPRYVVLDEQGPDHSKCFKISAVVAGRRYSAAWGPSKKEAEQRAAENALAELQGESAPHETE